jgi:hypothetical protein
VDSQYAAKEFGTCPLVQCQGQPVLPLGLKDEVGYDSVKVFCLKCQCVYHPPPPRRGGTGAVDGAAFGTTFAHLFLMTFNNLVPEPLSPDSVYVPRVFGFRVHSTARQKPGSSPVAQGAASSNPNASKNGKRGDAISAAAAAAGIVAAAGVNSGLSTGNKAQSTGEVENSRDLGMNPPAPNQSNQDGEHVGPLVAQAASQNNKTESGDLDIKNAAAPGENGDATKEGKIDGNGDSKDFSQSQEDSAGKTSSLQAKRRARGTSGSSPVDAMNANGASTLEALKASKRQKRPNSSMGT